MTTFFSRRPTSAALYSSKPWRSRSFRVMFTALTRGSGDETLFFCRAVAKRQKQQR